MLITTTNNITHCVIYSGYTGRLVRLFGFDNLELIQKDNKHDKNDPRTNNIYKINLSTKMEQTKEYNNFVDIYYDIFLSSEDDSEDTPLKDFMFIKDTLWGKGLYYVDNHNVENILNLLTEAKIQNDGIVCYKCTNMFDAIKYIKVLEKLHHCALFCASSIYDIQIIEQNDMKILVVMVDSESG